MSDYQDRADIDNLYFLIWDKEADDVLFVTKEEFEELSSKVLDISELDELFARKMDYHSKQELFMLFTQYSEVATVTFDDDTTMNVIWFDEELLDEIW